MRFLSLRLLRSLVLVTGLPWSGVHAQPAAPPEIKPTTTLEGGDQGGRFFGRAPDAAKVRHYFVAAESVLWDYAPAGKDEVCGLPLPPPLVKERKAGKLRYVQYTDATFAAQVIPNRSLGILGPALRGVVGEFLVVTFLNRTDQPLSLHPHGVRYDKDSEGALYQPAPGRGAAVAPGARFTYVWHLDEQSGPRPDEPSSKAWLYHSHVTGDTEAGLGLVGPIIVTDPARARADGMPRDVDREFAALFMIFDESGLGADAIEAAEYAGLPGMLNETPRTWAEVQQLLEQGARHAINGYVFGNLPGLQANEGERIRWYLFALGSEQDFHTAHWHGLRAVEEGRRRSDVVELLPASMKVADMVADNPGTWLFHCHVSEHMQEGMFASVTVHGQDQVGVSHEPAKSFLGYPTAAQSLRIERVAARADRALILRGTVTVFDGFAAFNETVRVEAAGRTLEFRPDKKGDARAAGGAFRVLNANDVGVVHGGLLEFELTLENPPPSDGTIALAMEIARGRHGAIVSQPAPGGR